MVAFSLFPSIVLVLQRVLGRWSARKAQKMMDARIVNLTIVSEPLSTYCESTVLNCRYLYVAKFETNALTSARTSALSSYIMEIPKYVLEAALYFVILALTVVQFLTNDWGAAAATTALFLATGSGIISALLRLQAAGISIRNVSILAKPNFFMYDYWTALSNNEIATTARVTAEEIFRCIESGHPGFNADIVKEEVGMRYESTADPAVSNISLSCSAGKSIALVGSTGAIKSILADLILNVLDPDLARFLVGGVTPREAILRWPGAISYVPQNVTLTIKGVQKTSPWGYPVTLSMTGR